MCMYFGEGGEGDGLLGVTELDMRTVVPCTSATLFAKPRQRFGCFSCRSASKRCRSSSDDSHLPLRPEKNLGVLASHFTSMDGTRSDNCPSRSLCSFKERQAQLQFGGFLAGIRSHKAGIAYRSEAFGLFLWVLDSADKVLIERLPKGTILEGSVGSTGAVSQPTWLLFDAGIHTAQCTCFAALAQRSGCQPTGALCDKVFSCDRAAMFKILPPDVRTLGVTSEGPEQLITWSPAKGQL